MEFSFWLCIFIRSLSICRFQLHPIAILASEQIMRVISTMAAAAIAPYQTFLGKNESEYWLENGMEFVIIFQRLIVVFIY